VATVLRQLPHYRETKTLPLSGGCPWLPLTLFSATPESLSRPRAQRRACAVFGIFRAIWRCICGKSGQIPANSGRFFLGFLGRSVDSTWVNTPPGYRRGVGGRRFSMRRRRLRLQVEAGGYGGANHTAIMRRRVKMICKQRGENLPRVSKGLRGRCGMEGLDAADWPAIPRSQNRDLGQRQGLKPEETSGVLSSARLKSCRCYKALAGV